MRVRPVTHGVGRLVDIRQYDVGRTQGYSCFNKELHGRRSTSSGRSLPTRFIGAALPARGQRLQRDVNIEATAGLQYVLSRFKSSVATTAGRLDCGWLAFAGRGAEPSGSR